MIRATLLCLLLVLPGRIADAACAGTDLWPTLPDADRAVIEAAVDSIPYPRGNFWRATRGGEVVHLVGTYHFDDPRHDAIAERLAPIIASAETLLVEAGPEEQERLKSEMARRPDRLFLVSGPTLPEQLEKADWQALASAMQARGIPAFMASKMQPWYVSMMLGVPPCAMTELGQGAHGLDQRVIEMAEAAEIPVRALEPYDTVFGLFDTMAPKAQIDMILTTLAMGDRAEDYSATLTAAYFNEDVRITWELGRLAAYAMPGATTESVDADMAEMEEALMNRRNRSWLPVIEAASAQGPTFVAFGALHLSGQDGVLALMERAGFTVERLTF
ncbi:TraB/GumN family protein [Defluviimonas sp. SAOS-178_SWC]|uniref:TraB/GumN family protein n=1 Tax=Defluviimonas sp. SAOS-178_SWC TaxID=3121287 RepID=UPI0032220C8F